MSSPSLAMPGRSGLLWRVLIAAVVGTFIVVCVVMPAEYRKDPTGFGPPYRFARINNSESRNASPAYRNYAHRARNCGRHSLPLLRHTFQN